MTTTVKHYLSCTELEQNVWYWSDFWGALMRFIGFNEDSLEYELHLIGSKPQGYTQEEVLNLKLIIYIQ